MNISFLKKVKDQRKTGLVKRQVIELYRMGSLTERQVLEAVGISRTILRRWNRYYQRYKQQRHIENLKKYRLMKPKNINEVALLKRKIADLEGHNKKLQLENEALITVIDLAESQFKIPIRKKYGPRQ
ncbi:hypothetical protein [Rudanella lutea]|uniref:hypothetical protein n=1 Tax=Rudanella lutea TaxID=451374 RepID=UPI000372FBA1|nr:hypothetical protein [Rudanella lutea]